MKRLTPTLRAFALGETILPIGFLPNGRPIFPIAGGAPDDPDDPDKGGDDPDKGGDKFNAITSQEELNRIVGERLARERAKYSDYEDLRAAKAEYDKVLEAAKTEQERAVEAARNEGKTEALTTANARLVSAEARALAAEAKFRNPALAVKAISLDGITVSDDGTVDEKAIRDRLKELSDAEPYLVDDGKPGRPKPDPTQGGGTGGKKAALKGLSGDELFDRLHPKRDKAS